MGNACYGRKIPFQEIETRNEIDNLNKIETGIEIESPNELHTAIDLRLLEEMVLDVAQFDNLLSIIDQRLQAIAGENDRAQQSTSTEQVGSSFMLVSSKNIGKDILMMVSKRAEKNRRMESSKSGYNHEIRNMVTEVLNGASQIQLLTAGVCVLGYLSDEIEQHSKNRDEFVQLLRCLCAIARSVNNVRGDRERLDEAVNFLFEGCVLCLTQIESHGFFQAEVDGRDLRELESQIRNAYPDLSLGLSHLDNTSHIPPTTQGQDPPVGIDEARHEIIHLLDLEDPSIRSVVLYGLEGIGKTTLATAVVSSLDLSAYKYCRINLHQYYSESDLKQLQEWVLWDLFNEKIQLRNSEEGQIKLLNLFREATSQPVFLFIDNVFRGRDLAKFLPQDVSCLPNRSRILLTTRKLDETDMIEDGGVKRYAYRVKSLSDAASIELLRRHALRFADNFFDTSINIDGLLKICAGMPRVLQMVGSKLETIGNNVTAYEDIIEFLNDTILKGESNFSESAIDAVYNSLGEKLYKDAFLDIAAFFNNWDERMVGYIVGEVALQALKEASLVTVTEEGKVTVHDIVQARARKMSEENRITNHSSLKLALGDKQKLAKVKGIWLPPPPHDSGEFQLQAEDLELMNKSLRILHIGERNRLNGESKEIFPNLRFLHIKGNLGMELTNLERLSVLEADLASYVELPDSLPLTSLKMLNLSGSKIYCLPNSFGMLKRLEDLNISDCEHLRRLPAGFGQLKSLTYLDISGCSSLEEIPEAFGRLKSLTYLDISRCSSLVMIPEAFGRLKSLKYLDISVCSNLRMIPGGFGQLTSLTYLDMSACSNLEMVPDDFGLLSGLEKLNISECRRLAYLPQSFGHFKSLTYLNMSGCSNLEMVSADFGLISGLEKLNISKCRRLAYLPQSFAQLSRLEDLNISHCEHLSRLPDGFGELKNLTYLDMSGCSNLEMVSDDFSLLSGLEKLKISDCEHLQSLPNGFGQLKSLTYLDMSGCSNLETIPDGFGQLKNLTYLNMSGCSNLKMISIDFEQLSSVCAVNASNCSRLDGKAMDKLVEMKSLLVLNIRESPMLKNRWKEIKEIHALIVQDGERESRLDEHPLSSALFHKESRFLRDDGSLQFAAEWSPGPGQVAFVMSICDLSWPSIEIVEEEIEELASQGFQIVYVCVGKMWKESMERIPSGTCAWIAPDEKWNILAGYSIFQLISPHEEPMLLSSLHTLIATALVTVDGRREKYVKDIKLTLPVSGDDEELKDRGGGFSRLFFPIIQMNEKSGQVGEVRYENCHK